MDRVPGHLRLDPKEKVKCLIWVKIIGIGSPGTGKTCLIKHFCESKFTTAYQPTVGVDYGFKIQHIANQDLRVHLWDLSGSPEYVNIRDELYADTNVIFLVYDMTNQESFNSLDAWLQEVNKNCNIAPIVAVVANKCDVKAKRTVSSSDGKKWAKDHKMRYFETSPATGEGVQALFSDVLTAVVDKLKLEPTTASHEMASS